MLTIMNRPDPDIIGIGAAAGYASQGAWFALFFAIFMLCGSMALVAKSVCKSGLYKILAPMILCLIIFGG